MKTCSQCLRSTVHPLLPSRAGVPAYRICGFCGLATPQDGPEKAPRSHGDASTTHPAINDTREDNP